MTIVAFSPLLAATFGAASFAADPPTPAAPTAVARVVDCRRISDPDGRLSCYDAAVDTLGQAVSGGSIVVVDREDIRRTRRSLFGFTLPKLPFLKDDRSSDDQPNRIVAAVTSARALPHGKWLIAIEGGAVWQTTQEAGNQSLPKVGDNVRISSGALGSYRLAVVGRPALRAMRVR